MVVDDTIRRIFNQIIEEVKEKYGKEYSIEHIYEVVNYQIEATKIGIMKKTAVFWDGFFKFIFIDTSTRQVKRKEAIKEIEFTDEHMPQEEKDAKIKEVVFIDSKRRGLLRAQGVKYNSVDGKDLLKQQGEGGENGVSKARALNNLPLFKNLR